MHKPENTEDGFRCPQCGSYSTQSVAMAYKQAVRTGHSGHQSTSQFADEIAPPPAKDGSSYPSLIACATAIFAFLELPGLLDSAGIGALEGLSPFSWPILALSCVCGWVVGLLFAIPAIRYNAFTLPPILREWQKGMICKRCFHRWQRLSSPELGELDDE